SHVYLALRDLDRARELGLSSLEPARRYADLWSTAMATVLLGHIELAAGRIEEARAYLAESAGIFQSIGNAIYVSWCLEGLAGLALADGRTELAGKLCGARQAFLDRLASQLP